jgi:hypothetical protein
MDDGSQKYDGHVKYPFTNENEMKLIPQNWSKGENPVGRKIISKKEDEM